MTLYEAVNCTAGIIRQTDGVQEYSLLDVEMIEDGGMDWVVSNNVPEVPGSG